jgi:transcriptional regulator with XRE-family HTH domain
MLRRVRLARGLSGQEFAAALGISAGLVSRVETGHLEPWPAFRRRAASVLQVDEPLLFGDTR